MNRELHAPQFRQNKVRASLDIPLLPADAGADTE